jgi:SAM-dependent methyltransferase
VQNLIISGDWARIDIPEPLHIYNEQYFENYVARSNTKIGRDLTKFRVELVNQYSDSVLDIGIGCGQFLSKCLERNMKVYGFDIMPPSVKWLKDRSIYWNPFTEGCPPVQCVTLFDCIEHLSLDNANKLLEIIKGSHVIVSLPIYEGEWDQISTWRHWKPQEHIQVWRGNGFVDWMEERGFDLRDLSFEETEIGRLDIETYVFV